MCGVGEEGAASKDGHGRRGRRGPQLRDGGARAGQQRRQGQHPSGEVCGMSMWKCVEVVHEPRDGAR